MGHSVSVFPDGFVVTSPSASPVYMFPVYLFHFHISAHSAFRGTASLPPRVSGAGPEALHECMLLLDFNLVPLSRIIRPPLVLTAGSSIITLYTGSLS